MCFRAAPRLPRVGMVGVGLVFRALRKWWNDPVSRNPYSSTARRSCMSANSPGSLVRRACRMPARMVVFLYWEATAHQPTSRLAPTLYIIHTVCSYSIRPRGRICVPHSRDQGADTQSDSGHLVPWNWEESSGEHVIEGQVRWADTCTANSSARG